MFMGNAKADKVHDLQPASLNAGTNCLVQLVDIRIDHGDALPPLPFNGRTHGFVCADHLSARVSGDVADKLGFAV